LLKQFVIAVWPLAMLVSSASQKYNRVANKIRVYDLFIDILVSTNSNFIWTRCDKDHSRLARKDCLDDERFGLEGLEH